MGTVIDRNQKYGSIHKASITKGAIVISGGSKLYWGPYAQPFPTREQPQRDSGNSQLKTITWTTEALRGFEKLKPITHMERGTNARQHSDNSSRNATNGYARKIAWIVRW